jgi:hypothetical protein
MRDSFSEPSLASPDYRLGAIGHSQLGEDARDVVAYGLGAQVKVGGYSVVGVALGHESEDLALAFGKVREGPLLGRCGIPTGRGEVFRQTPRDRGAEGGRNWNEAKSIPTLSAASATNGTAYPPVTSRSAPTATGPTAATI